MSMFDELGRLPNFDEMVAALSSPVVPPAAVAAEANPYAEEEMELSSEDMIREIFTMMRHSQKSPEPAFMGQLPTAAGLDSSFNSATATYDGLPKTMNYNGGF